MKIYRFRRILNEMDKNPYIQDDPHAPIFLNSYENQRGRGHRNIPGIWNKSKYAEPYKQMIHYARRDVRNLGPGSMSNAMVYMKKGW